MFFFSLPRDDFSLIIRCTWPLTRKNRATMPGYIFRLAFTVQVCALLANESAYLELENCRGGGGGYKGSRLGHLTHAHVDSSALCKRSPNYFLRSMGIFAYAWTVLANSTSPSHRQILARRHQDSLHPSLSTYPVSALFFPLSIFRIPFLIFALSLTRSSRIHLELSLCVRHFFLLDRDIFILFSGSKSNILPKHFS